MDHKNSLWTGWARCLNHSSWTDLLHATHTLAQSNCILRLRGGQSQRDQPHTCPHQYVVGDFIHTVDTLPRMIYNPHICSTGWSLKTLSLCISPANQRLFKRLQAEKGAWHKHERNAFKPLHLWSMYHGFAIVYSTQYLIVTWNVIQRPDLKDQWPAVWTHMESLGRRLWR
jgi:hypothetical protein